MNLIWSWLAGRWLVVGWLLFSAACLAGAYVSGRKHGGAAVEARWAAQTAIDTEAARVAQAAADAKLARQTEAAAIAAENYAHAQTNNARLAGINADLDRRLRAAIAEARRDPVPAAPADPGEPEPSGVGLDAGAVALALSGFSRECAERADGLRDQVNALIEAWPR